MSDQTLIRRKHSPVDLQQFVIRLDGCNRPLNIGSGKSAAVLGLVHEAGIATTENGELYLIENGIPQNDDINYLNRYREGECRIVQVTQTHIRDWSLFHSVTDVKPGVTLGDLFDACGKDYHWLTNNCWNAVQRMRVCANESEAGLTWQTKGIIAGAAVVAAGVLIATLSGDKKEKPQAEKN